MKKLLVLFAFLGGIYLLNPSYSYAQTTASGLTKSELKQQAKIEKAKEKLQKDTIKIEKLREKHAKNLSKFQKKNSSGSLSPNDIDKMTKALGKQTKDIEKLEKDIAKLKELIAEGG